MALWIVALVAVAGTVALHMKWVVRAARAGAGAAIVMARIIMVLAAVTGMLVGIGMDPGGEGVAAKADPGGVQGGVRAAVVMTGLARVDGFRTGAGLTSDHTTGMVDVNAVERTIEVEGPFHRGI